jgi:hypothetical protein
MDTGRQELSGTALRRLLIVLAVLLLGGGALAIAAPLSVRSRERQLRKGLEQIQSGIQNYAAIHDGEYPPDIFGLVINGQLGIWPANPYGGDMLPLRSDEEPRAGCVVYAPKIVHRPAYESTEAAIEATAVDYYIAVYGPENQGNSYAAQADAWKTSVAGGHAEPSFLAELPADQIPLDEGMYRALRGIAWERVSFIERAADYIGYDDYNNSCGDR